MVCVGGMRYVNIPVLKSDFNAPIERMSFAPSTFSLMDGCVIEPM
jgi:hypothetical protein